MACPLNWNHSTRILTFDISGTQGEGWFDPWQLVHSLKAKNMTNNVTYCEGDIVNFRFENTFALTGDGMAPRKRLIGVDVST